MKLKVMLILVIIVLSNCVVIVNNNTEIDAVDSESKYSNVNSYYYNGNYVRITETIHGDDVGYKKDGTIFEYDLLRTEYHTFPNSNGSWVLSKYYCDNLLIYLDCRDYRNVNGDIEADVDGQWEKVLTPKQDINLKEIGSGFLIAGLMGTSLGSLVGVAVILIAAAYVIDYIENGRSGTDETVKDKVESVHITSNNLIITFVNDIPSMTNIGGIEAPVYDFCDETLKRFDAFIYYIVLKSPVPNNDGNDTFISPIAVDREIALSVMRLNSSLYNIWTAYGDWADHLACDVYSSNMCVFHFAAQEMETFDHFHGKSLTGDISGSKAFYGFAWGQMYVSDDPDNWQIDSVSDGL